jgi:hypothetical protein
MLAYILALLLILAVFPFPYGYYTFLRIATTCGAILYCFHFVGKNQMNIVYLFALIGILFNPLIPVYFGKEIWMVIDIITAVLFIYFNYEKR